MLKLVGGIAAARSLVHGGQYAVHDGDKTWTVLPGYKKGRTGGGGGVRLENSVERISPSESKRKLKFHVFKNIMHLAWKSTTA